MKRGIFCFIVTPEDTSMARTVKNLNIYKWLRSFEAEAKLFPHISQGIPFGPLPFMGLLFKLFDLNVSVGIGLS